LLEKKVGEEGKGQKTPPNKPGGNALGTAVVWCQNLPRKGLWLSVGPGKKKAPQKNRKKRGGRGEEGVHGGQQGLDKIAASLFSREQRLVMFCRRGADGQQRKLKGKKKKQTS